MAETQPQLQPAVLRLSGMISQYFTAAPYPTRRASQPLPHFPERADARDIRGSPDRPAAVFACRKFVPALRSQAIRSNHDRLGLAGIVIETHEHAGEFNVNRPTGQDAKNRLRDTEQL
jgi:hypothetical protein